MDHTRKCYMNTIKWGIVGPGNIANKFAKAIKNVDGACLWAVASRSPERGSAFAEKYEIQNIFTSYEEMAESDVDAVYIATPHPFHKPCAEIFLKAKKHVLCEKPVCVNVAEATRLKDLAEENGVEPCRCISSKRFVSKKSVALVSRVRIVRSRSTVGEEVVRHDLLTVSSFTYFTNFEYGVASLNGIIEND